MESWETHFGGLNESMSLQKFQSPGIQKTQWKLKTPTLLFYIILTICVVNRRRKRLLLFFLKTTTGKHFSYSGDMGMAVASSSSEENKVSSKNGNYKAKRSKCPGIRVVGNRVYDSQNGKTCHQVIPFLLLFFPLGFSQFSVWFTRKCHQLWIMLFLFFCLCFSACDVIEIKTSLVALILRLFVWKTYHSPLGLMEFSRLCNTDCIENNCNWDSKFPFLFILVYKRMCESNRMWSFVASRYYYYCCCWSFLERTRSYHGPSSAVFFLFRPTTWGFRK